MTEMVLVDEATYNLSLSFAIKLSRNYTELM